MSVPPSLNAVVLVWAGSDPVAAQRCVRSILAENEVDRLVVVDDGAPAELVAGLVALSERVESVRNDGTPGVAGARNRGLQVALQNDPQLIVFVDDDARVEPGALQALRAVLVQHSNVGAVVPKVIAIESPTHLWRAGCTGWLMGYELSVGIVSRKVARITGRQLPAWLDFSRGAGARDDGRFDNPCDVAFAFGGAMMVRAAAMRETGWFDEAISPYGGEDIDYGLRMRAGGWRLRYEPAARFAHPLPPLTRDAQQQFFNQRNLLQVARRHLPGWLWWGMVVPDFVLLQLPLRALESAWNANPDILRSSLDALRWTVGDIRRRGLHPPIRGPVGKSWLMDGVEGCDDSASC